MIDTKAAQQFAKDWKGKGYEKGETQKFWLSLLSKCLGYEHNDTVLFEHHVSTGGFIDVWIRQSDVMIEQKSIGVDLDKEELRQDEYKTPLQQVIDYAASLPQTEQPKYFITCNFETFRVYDRTKYGDKELKDHPFEFTLEEFGKHPEYLNFIIDPNNNRLRKEKEVSEQAGQLIGQLYDMLRKQYIDPDTEEAKHSLNVLCVRLVFCLFCEDAGLFGEPDAFSNYLMDVNPANIRIKLQHLFDNLDMPRADRDMYDDDIKVFPYVNGGLFREKVIIPNFTKEIKDFLIEKVALPIDWSKISPTIFGGIFEGTLNPVTRRKGGMHYTSPENIHKVIDPLFLDDLKAEFEEIRTDEELSAIKRKNRFKKFHQKLCSLVFFDPACGSGNFLTETYICLRQLEYAVLKEYKSKQISAFDSNVEGEIEQRIKLDQFYGIEINDFAVAVAETALWISRLKTNNEYLLLLDLDEKDFPLEDRANIICENALRFNWNDLVEPSRVSYIIGNPPFVGSSMMNAEQKKEAVDIFGKRPRTNSIDYVGAWYYKSAEYICGSPIKVAYVSTKSITQGEQVEPFWSVLLDKYKINILFAYRQFWWDSEADIKAHVSCIIIGFCFVPNVCFQKRIYHHINDKDLVADTVNNINPYLVDAPNIVVRSKSAPISPNVPRLTAGNKPSDGGNLILSEDERLEIIKSTPRIEPYIRRYIGAQDYIHNNVVRYCLWLKDCPASIYENNKEVLRRIEGVRQTRLESSAAPTRKSAETPTLFFSAPQQEGDFLCIPEVTGGTRTYIPIGFLDESVIASNKLLIVPNATLYHFGILISIIHMSWMRTITGKLGTSYQYSGAIVYNNFPWPTPSDAQNAAIEQTAQGILDARALYPDNSLADLYDPDKMPAELKAAHEANDRAVMDAYGFTYDMTEPEIVAELMKMYQKLMLTK